MAPLKPVVLQPGQSAELKVTIRIGGAIGLLQHRALVEVDRQDSPPIEFWTTATVYPPARIEETRSARPILFPKQAETIGLTAFTYGTTGEPPAPLERMVLKSNLAVSWSGPSHDRKLERGVIESSRDFVLTLRAGNESVPHSDEVLLTDGQDTLVRYPVRWEVSPALKASPSAVITRASGNPQPAEVSLRAMDGREFQVLSVRSELAEVAVELPDRQRSQAHNLRLVIAPNESVDRRLGSVRVETDHPAQPIVKVSVMIPARNASTTVKGKE